MKRMTPLSSRPAQAIGRSAAVGVAAALVFGSALAAAPAFAAEPSDFPITSVAFATDTVSGGQQASGYFNGDTSLTEFTVPGGAIVCEGWYKNGESVRAGFGLDTPSVHIGYDDLVTNYGFAEGDTFGLAYFAQNSDQPEGVDSCAEPAFDTPGLVSATLKLGAPTVAPPTMITSTVTVAPVALTQGVAVDQIIPFETAAGWDWTTGAGWIAAGPQSGGDGFSPYQGLRFVSQDPTPGVAPTVRIVGTPAYSGTVTTGIMLSDGIHYADAPLELRIAAPANNFAINLNIAAGQPVAGATTQVFAAGLLPGADWSVTVRSTPVVVGSGTVQENGQLAEEFTIPAGLEEGLHSITLDSTLADGSASSSVLWFTVSATGTLVATSFDKSDFDALAETGADAGTALATTGALVLAGIALMGLVAYRRRSLTAQN